MAPEMRRQENIKKKVINKKNGRGKDGKILDYLASEPYGSRSNGPRRNIGVE
jgi:hypothetical protein